MIMVWVKWSEDNFQVASLKAEKAVNNEADAIHAGWDCCGNDLNMMTAAAKLSSRPL